jgi:hypothetical protein
VQAAAYKVSCRLRVSLWRQVRRLAIDNRLRKLANVFGKVEMTYAKLTEDVIVRLRGIRVSAQCALNDRESKTPNVALDAVCAASWVGTCLCNSA